MVLSIVDDANGAIRKLKAIKKFTGAKGTTAVTFERAIETIERLIKEIEKFKENS